MHIDSPTLLLNSKQCKINIANQVEKAKKEHVEFRPHFKTHQSHEIGRWYRDLGVKKITVSSLKMAEYFAKDGWADITIAFPLNILEIDRINRLAEKIQLNLLLSDAASITALLNGLNHSVHVYIEIDTGQKRSGFRLDEISLIEQILPPLLAHPLIHFDGFLTHSGHSYQHQGTTADLQRIHEEIITSLQLLRQMPILRDRKILISIGDTPIFSRCTNFQNIDEVRPGNMVFYDLTQHYLGSCTKNQLAIEIVCPIVSKQPQRNEVIIYGGAIHFSKDYLVKNDITSYGELSRVNFQPISSDEIIFIKSLSQEHGIVHVPDSFMKQINIGDLLHIHPVHSCLSANIMDHYLTEEGEQIEKFRYA